MLKLNFRQFLEMDYMSIGHDAFWGNKGEDILWSWSPGHGLMTIASDKPDFAHADWAADDPLVNSTIKGRIEPARGLGSIVFLELNPLSQWRQQKAAIDDLLDTFPEIHRWYVWDEFSNGIELNRWMQQQAA